MADLRLKKLGVGRRLSNDPLFAEGDRVCRMFLREGIIDIDDEQLCHQVVAVFPCDVPGCKETFASLMEFDMHYNSRHRYACRECNKHLPTGHLLDLHISETHDSFFAAQAERKPMYQCFVEECSVVSQDDVQRRKHCIEVHSFPPDFRFDQSRKKGNKKNTNKNKTSEPCEEAMMVDETQEKKPQKGKPITFGRGKQGKMFVKPWHAKGKEQKTTPNDKTEQSEISTCELMEALPS
ncbi:zinc finger protein 511-like [Macrosteles quadrilineatus]|uniref:zinc finger protein 511-like n=1 Tax=Macrosteles quadrilineatus TaxID=74068 RepID=UPI0023E0C484|nr:zinc finger protein 511-like [Macrosteles quadrilineatus]